MACTVVIVDDRGDVLELNRILLEAEGYEAQGLAYKDVTVERIRQTGPCVVLLDLVPGDEAPWELMRRLRSDPATREIGVVVTSDSPAPVDRALRDTALGVTAGLVMPFDLDALYSAISTAARSGPATAPVAVAAPFLPRAAAVIHDARQRILLRWVQRVSTLDAFRRHPEMSLSEVQGRVGDLVDGVVDALEAQGASRATEASTVGIRADAAREHARLRRAQRLSASDLVRETAMLRRELWREINPVMKKDLPPIDDVWALERRLHMALDETLCIMLDTWEKGAEP